ncbi:MAG: hypothetical protein ACE5KZ_12255 [Candidatus Scalinduaceae bacterium]
MSELIIVAVITTVSKNIVNVIKMLTKKAKRADAGWLVLSGVAGGLIVWAIGLNINIFQPIGVGTTPWISTVNGVLIGLMGQDFYKIMKIIQRNTPPKE